MICFQVKAQGDEVQNQKFVYESNLPIEIIDLYNSKQIKSNYTIRTDLNPFYLRGDFDGDDIPDYALSIIDVKSGKKGIIIYHTMTKVYFKFGAGTSLNNGNGGDDYGWMDSWKVITKREVEIGVGETEKIMLKGEAISVIQLESASALIYWNGSEYRWYQQGD